MRPSLPLLVLTGLGVVLVTGSLGLESARIADGEAGGDAPGLARPVAATASSDTSTAAHPPTEYCGPTRLGAVRRATRVGERGAVADILPPARWEAWPEVVRACRTRYGPSLSPGATLSRRR